MSGIYNTRGIWWRHFLPMLAVTLLLALPASRQLFTESGWRWFYILAFSFSLSFCLTPVFRNLSWTFGVLDLPSERKSHDEATPLLGGAAVFVAFFVSLIINGIYSSELTAILIGTTVLFVIGLIDDVRDISARYKLVAQIGCTLFVVGQGVILSVFPDKLGWAGYGLNAILTVFWVVGITNAMNFFDGMDGMASGLGVIISFFLGVVAFQGSQPFIGWIAVAMMGACFGFMPYNLMKNARATIFLGDSGSTIIGFVLACVAVYGDWAEGRPLVALVSPILIFWVLIFDMVHITVDRIVTGKVHGFRQWLEFVGKDHLHHRLARLLDSPKRAVFFIYLLNIHLGISAVVLIHAKAMAAMLILFQAMILVVLITILERRGRKLSAKVD